MSYLKNLLIYCETIATEEKACYTNNIEGQYDLGRYPDQTRLEPHSLPQVSPTVLRAWTRTKWVSPPRKDMQGA
jgi:hypothetical protein